ncbi:S-adenosyl-L-methionine-dependent methyltransferase [Syncephalis plumigaleata]|nr:S-adenosyl-L-methionine-dependent methyltransferase [Syncephalis plumigaleata]
MIYFSKQMSMQFPSCQFVGCDIVDQTSSEPLPSQCKFVNGDILKKLPFENDQFDLIRQSFLIFHIPGSKWQPVARELFRVCKANGTINLLELDWRPTRAGPLCGLVANALEDGQNKLKMDCRVNTRLSRLLVSAGFVDVTTRTVDVPLGYWGDNIGACMYQVFSQVMNSAEPMFRRLGTFAPKELDLRVDAMKQELDASYTASITLFIYSARKSISSSNAKH